jgi:dipicolinate synthase subunit A
MIYLIELSDKRNIFLFNKIKRTAAAEGFSFTEQKNQSFKGAVVVFSPARRLSAEEAERLPPASIVLGGGQSAEVMGRLKQADIRYVNLLQNEDFAVRNAKLTAEGTLSLIIGNTDKSIYDNNVLILGCGRIGKALAVLLKRTGMRTAVATFDRAEYEAYSLYADEGYFKYAFADKLDGCDIIVNTVPAQILDDAVLKRIQPKTVIIELASSPCLDRDTLGKYPFKYITAGSLPVVFSAMSAADIMLDCVFESVRACRNGAEKGKETGA